MCSSKSIAKTLMMRMMRTMSSGGSSAGGSQYEAVTTTATQVVMIGPPAGAYHYGARRRRARARPCNSRHCCSAPPSAARCRRMRRSAVYCRASTHASTTVEACTGDRLRPALDNRQTTLRRENSCELVMQLALHCGEQLVLLCERLDHDHPPHKRRVDLLLGRVRRAERLHQHADLVRSSASRHSSSSAVNCP